MNRRLVAWSLFAAIALLGLAGLGWITRAALRVERSGQEATRRARLEARMRTAQWRLDAFLTRFQNMESTRPHHHYQPFRAVPGAGLVLPSPLLVMDEPLVRLRFQVDERNRFTSPALPDAGQRALALRAGADPERMEHARQALVLLQASVDRKALREGIFQNGGFLMERDQLPRILPYPMAARGGSRRAGTTATPRAASPAPATPRSSSVPLPVPKNAAAVLPPVPRGSGAAPPPSGSSGARRSSVSVDSAGQGPQAPGQQGAILQATQGSLTAFWHQDRLLLVRQVWSEGSEVIQGVWVDWDFLKPALMGMILDLFPEGDLRPAATPRPGERTSSLASLPLKLVPGTLPPAPGGASPVKAALLLGWGLSLLTLALAAVLLQAGLTLGERKGAFAAAVTHELRTPLTTFRLYAEMLACGMVPEEELRSYHATLLSEAERLDHLVRNVLSYARLEARRTASLQVAGLEELLERPLVRAKQRAAQAGMALLAEIPAGLGDLPLRTDPIIVEQILLNLTDNACKYAASGGDSRLELTAAREDGHIVLRFRDYGPGIPRKDQRRLFRAFHRSARTADRSAPGVGLGLALSRRLARSLGGELLLDAGVTDGACFLLRLPIHDVS